MQGLWRRFIVSIYIYIYIYTPWGLTFNNSAFCPQSCIYVFCVDLRSINIKCRVYGLGGGFLLRGANRLCKLRLICVFRGLINDEVGRLWKEAVVTSFDKLFPALTWKEGATSFERSGLCNG